MPGFRQTGGLKIQAVVHVMAVMALVLPGACWQTACRKSR